MVHQGRAADGRGRVAEDKAEGPREYTRHRDRRVRVAGGEEAGLEPEREQRRDGQRRQPGRT